MLPISEHWTITLSGTPVEVSLPELGTRLSDEACEASYEQWFFIREMLRYPEPYYADELIATVLEIYEVVTGRREKLYGDQRDDFVWQRIFGDMDFVAQSGAVIFKEQVKHPLPVLDEPDDLLSNYKPQATVPEQLTFIGLRLKDKKGNPIRRFRVRLELPDGHIKEGRTNSEGELYVDGIALPGNARIQLLDDCIPGDAEAPPWPEEGEYLAGRAHHPTCQFVRADVGLYPLCGICLW